MQYKIKGSDIEEFHKYMLVLIGTRNEPIKGKTKFQKMMFVLSHIFDEIKDQTDFDSDYYGPYSEIVESELEYLEQISLVTERNNRIRLTDKGEKYAKQIVESMDKRTLSILNEHKEFFNDMTKNELLTYIYLAYPETTSGSVVYEPLKPNMEKHVISLIKKEKITPQRAAELLDKEVLYVYEKMVNEGMVVFE